MIAAAAIGFAQPPLPTLKVEAITGGSVLIVGNTGKQPLTAYYIELADYPGSSFTLAQDDLLGGDEIPPGGEKRTQVTNMTIGAVPEYVKMRAAIYADGSTSGAPEKVAQLLGRRKAQLETARSLITLMLPTPDGEPAKAELIEAMGKLADFLKPPGKPNPGSPEWANQAAKQGFVLYFKSQLESQTPAEVLQGVRAAEAKLASSKPAL